MKADEPMVIYLADPRKWNAKLIVRKAVKYPDSQGRNPQRPGNWWHSLHLKIWTAESLLLPSHGRRLDVYALETIKVSDLRKN